MFETRRICATLALAGAVGCSSPQEGVTTTVGALTSDTLAGAASQAGLLAGTAVANAPLASNPAYAATLVREFAYVTPENETKWGSLQPSPGVWDFSKADPIFDFAEANGLKVKGHTLVWHSQLPSFINDDMTADELSEAMVTHIRTVTKHYAGRAHAWDVVNEAVADDGSGLRDTVFVRKLGGHFIDQAFKLAHAFDKDARLYYNDYGTETINPKSDRVFMLVQDLLKRQVPIDGVGFQFHIDAANPPSKDAIKANLQRFTALGLEVNISELDVSVRAIPGSRARKLAFQKVAYNNVALACKETPGCVAITTWGFSDPYSWKAGELPLPFDAEMQKKPAYYGMMDGLLGIADASRGSVSNFISNPSFEQGLDGWSGRGATLSQTSAAAHAGTQSALVSSRTATWQGPMYAGLLQDVNIGYSYQASAWVQIATADALALTAQITCQGGTTEYKRLGSANGVPGQWVNLRGTLAVPSCVLAELGLYVEGPAVGVDMMLDDVFVGGETRGDTKNIIPNPDFENGVAGWTTWGATIVSTGSRAHTGMWSAQVTNRTSSWQGPVLDVLSLVQAGQSYPASIFVQLGSGADQTLNLTLQATCEGASASYKQVGSIAASSSEWRQISGTLAVPSCKLVGANLYVEGASAGTDVFIDDAFLGAPTSAPPNLLPNGTFEAGTSSWYTWGGAVMSVTTARAHGGSQSCLVANRTASNQGANTELTQLVTSGKSYTLSGWVQVGGTVDQSAHFTAAITTASGTSYSWVGGSTPVNGSIWTRLSGTISVPEGMSKLTVYLEGPAAGVDVYLDDVTLTAN